MSKLTLKPGQYFVVGTDTEVGKTYSTCWMMRTLAKSGATTLGLKPIAAGVDSTQKNEDALALQAATNVDCHYDEINPICLSQPASPHIAAALEHKTITCAQIETALAPALKRQLDFTFIEGAGGWFCPVNDSETLADLCCALQLPIILVVGIKLGCLNHSLLTVECIQRTGLPIAGWIANCLEPDTLYIDENVKTLEQRIAAPLLARLERE